MQHTAKNTRLYMKMCAGACISRISEKSAIVTIAFNDLAMKMCNQLRATTRWISFVLLVFISHCVFLFQQDMYCNLSEGFGLISRDTYRAVPKSWSYCFRSLMECGKLPPIRTFSEGFFLQPEWSKASFGTSSLVWWTHALKRRIFFSELQSCGWRHGSCLALIE